jgi:hypothetical protein
VKKCPKCGSAYTDEFIYCDQDGTALRLRSRLPPWILSGAGLLLLSGLAIATPTLLANYFKSKITLTVVEVSAPLEGRNSVAALESFYALVKVQVRNTSAVSPKLQSANLTCTASGQKFADLIWPSQGEQPLEISSNAVTDISVRLQSHISSPLGLVILASKRNLSGDCRGAVRFSIWGITINKGLSFETKLW